MDFSATLVPPLTVLALFAARSVELGVRRGAVAGAVAGRWSLPAMIASGTAVTALGLAEYWVKPGFSPWFYGIGLAVGLASFALRHQAARALGAYWSVQVEVRDCHPVVTSGPYALMAHPIYTAAILELVGAILVLRSWWALAGFALFFIPALWARIRLEEAAMVKGCGLSYSNYLARTARLIPSVF